MSLRVRLFTVLFIILSGAAIIIWYGIKPSYEDTIMEERLTLITEYQQQRIRESEIQLFFWLKTTTELMEVGQNTSSAELEQTFTTYSKLFSDLLGMQLVKNNESTTLLVSDYQASFPDEQTLTIDSFQVSTDPELYAGWFDQDKKFQIRIVTNNDDNQLSITTIFDATKINQIMLQNVLRGNAFTTIWKPDASTIGFSMNPDLLPVESPSTMYYSQTLDDRIYLAVASPFGTLPLIHTIFVDQSYLQQQVSQLFSQSLIMLIITFLALAAGGHLLISRVQRPINTFLEDVGPFANYEFDKPFRPTDLPELAGISTKMEDIRLKLHHYKKINVEQIILHDHRNRLLMNHAIEMVGQYNDQGKFFFINEQMQELFNQLGLSNEDSTVNELLTHHQVHTREKKSEISTKDHLIIHSQFITIEVDLPDEKSGFYQIHLNDITDQNETHLGGMILLINQTKDKEIERMRSEMLNLIVHELQNPVNAGLGLTNYLLDEPSISDKEHKEVLSMIKLSMENLMGLIERFLKVSRLESVNIKIDRVRIDLNKMIPVICNSFKSQLDDKKINLVMNNERVSYIKGAPELLEDVFKNLISNAIKYGSTERTIYVALWESTDKVHFSITDHGYGIPDEHREKIFQKFYRIQSYSKEKGTGLGLAYVKEIIKKHNGDIKLESNAEIGSRFTISLPI